MAEEKVTVFTIGYSDNTSTAYLLDYLIKHGVVIEGAIFAKNGLNHNWKRLVNAVTHIPQTLVERIRRDRNLVSVSVRHCQFSIRAYLPDDSDRTRVEEYIQTIFSKHYKASVNDFHPLLITIENNHNEIIAALGLRFAEQQRLVAEEYSDKEAEYLFSEHFKINGERKNIIEIGNLASSHSGYAKFLFVAMTRILTDWHFQWLTFTAVPSVINVFKKLKLNPIEVCMAHLSNLKYSNSNWGEYYQHNPRVMIGDIRSANHFLEQQGSYQRINFQWV